MNETKTGKGRKELVKTILIVFLALLLVLTFFSNTIMNRSLPEVAAQYPVSSTLTTKIRGNGTVEATQNYNVSIDEARTVASVEVKVGDTVTAGQVLAILDEKESEELTAARKTYEELSVAYQEMLIEMAPQNAATAAQLAAAQAAVTEAAGNLSKARVYESGVKGYESAVSNAQSNVTNKQIALSNAQNAVTALQSQRDNLKVTDSEYVAAVQAYNDAVGKQEAAQVQYDVAREYYESTVVSQVIPGEGDEAPTILPGEGDPAAKAAMDAAYAALLTAKQNTADALTEQQRVYSVNIAPKEAELDRKIASAQATVNAAQSELDSANAALTKAQEALSNFQQAYSDYPTSVSAAESALQAARENLNSLNASLQDAAVQATYDDEVATLKRNTMKKQVDDAWDAVVKLEEKATAADITSRYDGVVTEVSVAAGDTTEPGTPFVVIELVNKGYSMKATVTKDQARTLREGMPAEVTNKWNADISMVLTGITADKESQGQNKILTFALTGEDVKVGENISFSVGDKSANFDVVLPSSAVHSDANGSFVYVVEVRSGALSNRYVIRKADVKVLASDETNSAVSGDVGTGDFVVTTATVPIEAGMQVRMAQ